MVYIFQLFPVMAESITVILLLFLLWAMQFFGIFITYNIQLTYYLFILIKLFVINDLGQLFLMFLTL